MFSCLRKIACLFSRKDKWQIFGFTIMLLVSAILETFGIALIFPLMSLMTNPGIIHSNAILKYFYDNLHMASDKQFILTVTFLVLFMFVAKNAFMVWMLYLQERFLETRRLALHKKLYTAFIRSPYIFHLQNNSAILVRNIGEVETIFQSILQPVLRIITDACIAAFLAGLLLVHNPKATLVIFVLLGGSVYLFYVIFKKKLVELGKVRISSHGKALKSFFQGLGGIKDVQVLNRENSFINAYVSNTAQSLHARKVFSLLNQVPRLGIEVLTIGIMLFVMVFLILREQNFVTIIPTLSLFALGSFRILPALNRLLPSFQQLNFNYDAVDLLYDELQRIEKGRIGFEESPAFKEKLNFTQQIELKDLKFRYPSRDIEVIKDISMTIPKGRSTAFVGSSGAGKTTLIDMILGLLPPTSGKILVDGKDIQECMTGWRKNIGYVSQFIFIADDTLRANIAFGIPENEIDEAALIRTAEAARLTDVIKKLPLGFDTILGENGVQLSGGQRQRVGIARALYHNPEVLILDEATSLLDGETEREVTQAIEKLSHEKTFIVIAHRLSTVKNCDNIWFMEDGKIADQGTFAELLAKNEQFLKMANGVSLSSLGEGIRQ